MPAVKYLYRLLIVALLLSSASFYGCNEDGLDNANFGGLVYRFDFCDDDQGWVGGFADYPAGEEAFFELVFDHRALPFDIDPNCNRLFISGNNHSDDLFMFVKKQVTGLEPNTTYLVRFEVEIASEAGDDCGGIGGSPAITLKAGATIVEPVVVNNGGFLEMNIDKGNQSQGGTDADVIGNIGVNTNCVVPSFKRKRLGNDTDNLSEITTDGTGTAWLIVGTDSGFEGTTNLFYIEISAVFAEE